MPPDCIEKVVCHKREKLYAGALSEDSSQECLEIKAAAARAAAAAAGRAERLRENASGASPRYPNRQSKPQKLREAVARIEFLVAEEKHEFKVDLRIEGIPQDAILEGHERMTKIQKMVDRQATSWIPYRIDHCRFGEDWKIRHTKFSEESSRTI